jgi:hypothetical protein
MDSFRQGRLTEADHPGSFAGERRGKPRKENVMERYVLLGAAAALLAPCWAAAQDGEKEFTTEFPIEDCQFRTTGNNPYFKLKPGRQLYLNNADTRCEGGTCEELEELWITVLDQTRNIRIEEDGEARWILTRVVQEEETADGELVEISRNFFAECAGTEDVYYFGEEVDIYEDGRVVSHEGAWLAGHRRAEPGIIMPGGAFLLGARYFQEIAPGVALDRAEHVSDDLEIEVPAGEFDDCVAIEETTPLDPDSVSEKIYCPGTGLMNDGDLELVSVIQR